MPDPHQEIADLEAEIERLSGAAERRRKIIMLAKMATGAGSLLFIVILIGLVRFGPAALVMAITAVLGGLALFGSHMTTRDQIRAKIRAHEVRRAQVIAGLELRPVRVDEGA